MIVTRNWLSEYIDLSEVSSSKICEVLNRIGLEVDSFKEIRVPEGVVVGKVLECQKHPDANKLNVCQVDLGSEVKQIVCGAKNVAKDQFVAVATVGCDLGEGFVIKEAKLRGIDSHGMICGSNEIGLPKLNDGIWVLDESLGELVLGKSLREYPLINDDIIDIELTANRGDCLSIYGVARDLSSALDIALNDLDQIDLFKNGDIDIKAEEKLPIALSYMRVDKSYKSFSLIDLRLGFIDRYSKDSMKNILSYTTHSTGVLFRGYERECDSIEVVLDSGLPTIKCQQDNLSIVGVNQTKEPSEYRLIEASYINPDFISKAVMGKDIDKDELFYNSSRGSESDLDFGMSKLASLLKLDSLSISSYTNVEKFTNELDLIFEKIDSVVGQSIDRDRVISILQKLRFKLDVSKDRIHIKVPTFRHDIINEQDLIEEIVRVIGIDNIKSKPITLKEKRAINSSYIEYKKRNFFRSKAVGAGFYEAIHYFFDSKELQNRYKLPTLKEELDLSNPITSELDTIRTTLLLHHLRSASLNIKNSKSSVKLFEIGRVVDEDRKEHNKIAFIASGLDESYSVANSGKPKEVSFLSFATDVMGVVGEFKLYPSQNPNKLLNPYECGDIYIDGKCIGYIGELHIDVRDEFSLPKTYICEINFDEIKYDKIIAKSYSKFPSLSRDLSLLKPKDLPFSTIKDKLLEQDIQNLVGLYPINLYQSSELGDSESLTIRFILQSDTKTLNEDEINDVIDSVISRLKSSFEMELR